MRPIILTVRLPRLTLQNNEAEESGVAVPVGGGLEVTCFLGPTIKILTVNHV